VTDDWPEDVPVTEAEIAAGHTGCPGTRVGSAAARQHAGDHSLRRAIAKSRANATSIVGRDFRPNHTERRAIASPRRPMDCAMMKECR